jgi:2-(1,2-epoxy-1,2-dihydrophenyl)acetyl-CoA isomerase
MNSLIYARKFLVLKKLNRLDHALFDKYQPEHWPTLGSAVQVRVTVTEASRGHRVAALPGPAAGAGLSLALACDMRIMASSAIMTTAFARVGFSGDYGGTYFLTQLVGSAKARELYYLSERVSAEEALRLGLANWIAAPEDLAARTREIALRLASGPTVAYRYMKENLNRARSGEVDDCLDLEATHHVHCGQTTDHKEAARAFVDKREPVFIGR